MEQAQQQQAQGSRGSRATAYTAAEEDVTPPGFDLVYIDGSHLRLDVLSDASMAWRLLREGGVMVFDDYEWDRLVDRWISRSQGTYGEHAGQVNKLDTNNLIHIVIFPTALYF